MAKPAITVARAVFPEVITRLQTHFDVLSNQTDTLWSPAELVRNLQGRAGLFLHRQ